jgi:tRNA A37 threonylcarbamoyltransferase TsaD
MIGETTDDAVDEAFDKVPKSLTSLSWRSFNKYAQLDKSISI